MFENPTYVGVSQRVVATLVACAMLLAVMGLHTAQAANLTDVSDTLSDSAPSVTSAHTIEFTNPTAVASGQTITITFPAGFTGVASAAGTVSGAAGSISAAGQVVTVTLSSPLAADTPVTVAINDSLITNPGTIGSYELEINIPSVGDSGRTRVAIVDTVLVTAEVATIFDFIISGVATSTSVNGETTTGGSSTTTIPFGVLAPDTPYVMAQDLSVTTNARNGFVVTVEQDGDLQSSTGAVIDSFTDGTYVNTPTAWALPDDDYLDETTWGHWGLTSEDADLNGDEFGSALYVAASTTPRVIFSHASSSDGTTPNVGSTRIGYKIEITPLQEAGDDYNTTLTYIATPTF